MESCLSWYALRIFTAHSPSSLPYCFQCFPYCQNCFPHELLAASCAPGTGFCISRFPTPLRRNSVATCFSSSWNEETMRKQFVLLNHCNWYYDIILCLWYHSMSMISMINHVIQLLSNYQLSLHIPRLRHNVAINYHIFPFCGPLRPQDLHQQWSQKCLLSGGYQSTNYAAILHYIISI